MLAKCANPTCDIPFRRLSEGKLFLVESELEKGQEIVDPKRRMPPRRTEYFWLCAQCALLVTLTFSAKKGVMTVPLPRLDEKIPPPTRVRRPLTAEPTAGMLARAAGYHHD